MKRALYFLTILTFVPCFGQQHSLNSPAESKTLKINNTVPDEASVILLGQANQNGLKQAPFKEWYIKNYAEYDVDKNISAALKHLLKDVKVKVFMGTWCEDSQRETPKFYKIMAAAEYSKSNIALISVSRINDTVEGFEVGLNIISLPTFIFYKNDKEIHRIVESPMISLEKDMITILTGQEYKHRYEE